MSLTLAERVRSGDVRAMARAISLIEDEAESAAALVRDISAARSIRLGGVELALSRAGFGA